MCAGRGRERHRAKAVLTGWGPPRLMAAGAPRPAGTTSGGGVGGFTGDAASFTRRGALPAFRTRPPGSVAPAKPALEARARTQSRRSNPALEARSIRDQLAQ